MWILQRVNRKRLDVMTLSLDPKLSGYVVAISHHPEYPEYWVGQLIPGS